MEYQRDFQRTIAAVVYCKIGMRNRIELAGAGAQLVYTETKGLTDLGSYHHEAAGYSRRSPPALGWFRGSAGLLFRSSHSPVRKVVSSGGQLHGPRDTAMAARWQVATLTGR